MASKRYQDGTRVRRPSFVAGTGSGGAKSRVGAKAEHWEKQEKSQRSSGVAGAEWRKRKGPRDPTQFKCSTLAPTCISRPRVIVRL